jgi:hypothetical protein
MKPQSQVDRLYADPRTTPLVTSDPTVPPVQPGGRVPLEMQ